MDSSALAIALSRAREHVVLGHVVHDLRPAEQAQADCDDVRALAATLMLPFDVRCVSVTGLPGNAEANARSARYTALAAMSARHGCPFVATGHQADDQAETMLMAAARGAGLRGLSGIEPVRRLSDAVRLVRPMLGVSRPDAWAICASARWEPVCDETNADPSRARAGIRMGPLGEMLELMPSLSGKLGETAAILREAEAVVRSLAHELWTNAARSEASIEWPRSCFERQSWLVIAAHLRDAHRQLSKGTGADRLSQRVVRPVAERLSEPPTDGMERTFAWRGVTVEVSPLLVRMLVSDAAERGQW